MSSQPIMIDLTLPPGTNPQATLPSRSISPNPYLPRTIPLGLNHYGEVPPGHYPFGQIPFLFPPPGVYSTLVMATLSLPNITLGIPVWYIDPLITTPPNQLKPYTALILV